MAPRGCRSVRGIGAVRQPSQGVGVSGVYWGLVGSVGTQGQKAYMWHKGALRSSWGLVGVRGHWGHKGTSEGVGVSGVHWGLAGSVVFGARRGISAIRGH